VSRFIVFPFFSLVALTNDFPRGAGGFSPKGPFSPFDEKDPLDAVDGLVNTFLWLNVPPLAGLFLSLRVGDQISSLYTR